MPFALVHLNAVMLWVFTAFSPFVISCLMSHPAMAVATSIVVVCGYTSMWLVANELEDPFGKDANDIPVLAYHLAFCNSLQGLLRSPWMEHDVAHATYRPAGEAGPPPAAAAPPAAATSLAEVHAEEVAVAVKQVTLQEEEDLDEPSLMTLAEVSAARRAGHRSERRRSSISSASLGLVR